MPSEKVRAYIYRVLTAAAPLVTFYGYANEQAVAMWLAVAATVLGFGLASVNTSTKS